MPGKSVNGVRVQQQKVLGVVPGILGCVQALEALKIVGEFGSPLSEKYVKCMCVCVQFLLTVLCEVVAVPIGF